MLKIKAKKGYNIIIADLDVTLRSDGDWIEVNKKTFENSEDAKKLKKFIEITESELTVEEEKVIDNENKILQVTETSFVVSPKVETETKEVFVKEESSVEESKEDKIEGTVLDVEEDIPIDATADTIVEEAKIEVETENVKTEEVKEKIKKETKPVVPKKPNNKKQSDKK